MEHWKHFSDLSALANVPILYPQKISETIWLDAKRTTDSNNIYIFIC